MNHALRHIAVFAVAAAFACSSGGSGGQSPNDSGTADGGMGVAAFCSAVVMADSTFLSKCVGGEASAWDSQLLAANSCTDLAAAVTAGRVTYDPTKAPACLAAAAAVGCDAGGATMSSTACKAALAGTVAAGGACYAAIDCAGGSSFCSGLGGASGSCSGTCKPLVAAGASCAAGEQCVQGYSCTGTAGALTCTANAAPSGAALGATCGYDATTKTTVVCGSGLACDAKTLKCETIVKLGGACTPGGGVCELFTSCDPTSKTCHAYPGMGGSCGTSAGQDFVGCTGTTYCKLSGATGTCTTLGALGASCTLGAECASKVCKAASVDGGTGDAGSKDAGSHDAGSKDAGSHDAGGGGGTCTAPCTQQ